MTLFLAVAQKHRGQSVNKYVLTLLLFNFFTNDLLFLAGKCGICSFTNEKAPKQKGKGPSVLQISKNSRHEFEITIKWFKVNSLKEWCKKISILILGNWN